MSTLPIIFIGGTPGVGKTTVAKELARKIGISFLSLGELVQEEGFYTGYDVEKGAYIVDMEAVKRKLETLVKGRRMIVEAHIASGLPSEQVEVAVILRLDPRVLEKRLKERGYPWAKVVENVQAEILDSCLIEAVENFGVDKVFEVDTTEKTVESVVDEVLAIIRERKGSKPGSVNWLEKLGEKALEYLEA